MLGMVGFQLGQQACENQRKPTDGTSVQPYPYIQYSMDVLASYIYSTNLGLFVPFSAGASMGIAHHAQHSSDL